MDAVKENVKEYYGKVLQTSSNLLTNACTTSVCPNIKVPKSTREAMALIHEDVTSRYYGCGLVFPEKLTSTTVLDLGCGTGRDCFILSKLCGANGKVVGIDMTEEQLAVARKYEDYHRQKFAFETKNTEFLSGYIENLKEAGLNDDIFDVIVSNCVVNLSPDKKAVLSEAYRVLKVGGELYFSDVYSDKELTEDIRQHKVAWGECLGGALCWTQLHKMAAELGFSQPRLVAVSPIEAEKEDLKQLLDGFRFVSATYRLFKLPPEQKTASVVTYQGETCCDKQLQMDLRTKFEAGKFIEVDSELATILHFSRFHKHFNMAAMNGSTHMRNLAKENPFEILDGMHGASNEKPSCCSGAKCC